MSSFRITPVAQERVPASVTSQQHQTHRQLIRLGTLVVILALFILPLLPSPLAAVDWRAAAWGQVAFLLTPPLPDPALDLPIPPAPVLEWIYRILAGAGMYLVLALVLHLGSLYGQRTRPLAHSRTYLLLRTPLGLSFSPGDGLTLLRTLHGMLPATTQGAPLVLRWSGQPEQAVAQGVSILGSSLLMTSVQKTLMGLGSGTQIEESEDPLLAACGPDRYMCWSEVRLAAADDLPIAVPAGDETALIDALLPALIPQQGVYTSDVQIILRPIADRYWRWRVLARLEAAKGNAGSSERRALEQKAAGPTFDVCMRLLAVAASPQAGTAMVQTLGATLAASAQATGPAQQRLVAGHVRCLPTVLASPPPLPIALLVSAWTLGAALACTMGAILAGSEVEQTTHLLWALPPLIASLPWALVGTVWRIRSGASRWEMLRTLLYSVPPARNPHVIPLWSDWFGRNP